MRRLLALALCSVMFLGCHRAPPAPSEEAKVYVSQLNEETDPQKIKELSQKLYACGPKALDAISEALIRYDYRAKPQLVAIASAMPDPRALWLVDKQLHNRVQAARTTACYGLTFFPHAPLGDAAQMMRREADSDREWGLYALAGSDLPHRKSYFVAGLKDKNEYIRAQALKGFRTLPGTESIKLVTPLLGDKSPTVSAEAFLTLARLDPRNPLVTKKVKVLGEHLLNAKESEKDELLLLLAAVKTPDTEPYLSKVMGDADPRVRSAAMFAYARIGKGARPERLRHSLSTDPDISVRHAAGKALAELGGDGSGPLLNEMLKSKDSRVVRIALTTMAAIRRTDCMGPLLTIANHSKDPWLRRRAAVGLSNMGIRKQTLQGVEELFTMAASDDPASRREAAQFLGDLQGPRFYCELQRLMGDPDPGVRLAAMEAMKKQTGMPLATPKVLAHPLPSWLEGR